MRVDPVGFQTVGGEIGGDEVDGFAGKVEDGKVDGVNVFALQKGQHALFGCLQFVLVDSSVALRGDQYINGGYAGLLFLHNLYAGNDIGIA